MHFQKLCFYFFADDSRPYTLSKHSIKWRLVAPEIPNTKGQRAK